MGKFLFAASLLCLCSLANAENASTNDWSHAKPKIEVQVKRMQAKDAYVVTAAISDINSGKMLAQPKLITHAGTPARIEVGEKGAPGAITVDVEVTVASSGATASYASEIRDNDKMVSSQLLTLAVSD